MAKIVVCGAPGAGTTTFVGAASEITPLGGAPPARTADERWPRATVGFDFGRLTVPPGLRVCLFGCPGRRRQRLLIDVAVAGASAAVVLVDRRDPEAGRAALDRALGLGVPVLVAVNRIGAGPGGPLRAPAPAPAPAPAEVARRLAPGSDLAVVGCDARSRESTRAVLAVLLGSLRMRLESARRSGPAGPVPAARWVA